MAKKPQKESKETLQEPQDDGGWEEVTSERAPWVVKEPGLVVQGYLLGRFSWGSGRDQRWFYQLQLTGSGQVPCVQGSGDDQEEIVCSKGDKVTLGETFALQRDLAPLTTDGGKYEVRIAYGSPEKDARGKPQFWPVKVSKKTVRPPTRAPQLVTGNSSKGPSYGSEDDVPF